MEILSIIVSWPEDVITFFVLLVTLVSAYSFKENKYINKWASIILFTIIFAIPFNVFDVFYDEFNLYLIMLIGCGLLYALLFVNYDLKNVMTTFVSCLFTFVSIKGCIGILFSLTLSSYVSQYSFNFFSALLYYLAIIAVSAFYKRHALKSTSVQPYSYWFFMFLAPVLIYTADRLQILSYFSIWGSYRVQSFYGLLQEFVLCFLISSVLFLPLDVENVIYGILLFAMMISGYLDDASKTPWNEYKKGLIDLVISVVAVLTYMNFNSTTICFGADEIVIPKALFLILGVILIWVSVNVTNCTDGVDGLCASLCSVTLLAFGVLFASVLQKYAMANFLFLSVLFAYLYFNSSPSSMLMGDAGSRALGFYIAVIALKSTHPFIYILLAAVMIVDGGIGLVKIALKRFLKISILKKTRTPLHDHVRKNLGWSDTQVVVRFLILQTVLAAVAYCLI